MATKIGEPFAAMTDVPVEDRMVLLSENGAGYIDYIHYCLLLAERVGFEPTVGKPDTRSPGVPVRPLQHLSAERVGFEPTRHFCLPLFESGTINHSVTSPTGLLYHLP